MIAITGAAGFIGSNLALRLAADGHDLLLVDLPLSAARAANLVGLNRFTFVDHERFLAMLDTERPALDAVFHLGACSSTTETNWDFLRRNNIAYSQALWTWAAEHGKPFIYASSAATYGDGSAGFSDRTPPGQLHPLNLYGRSKNDFDAWVLDQVAAGKPAPRGWAGLKFFNVYGPREAHKGPQASVVWKAYNEILATGRVRLFKSTDPGRPDGGQQRDFVFVGDCVAHMLWLWRHPEQSGLYNSGTGVARSFLDLAHATFAALGRPAAVDFIAMPEPIRRHYQNFTQADLSKLRAAGCDVAVTALEDGVRRYVEWCVTHRA